MNIIAAYIVSCQNIIQFTYFRWLFLFRYFPVSHFRFLFPVFLFGIEEDDDWVIWFHVFHGLEDGFLFDRHGNEVDVVDVRWGFDESDPVAMAHRSVLNVKDFIVTAKLVSYLKCRNKRYIRLLD